MIEKSLIIIRSGVIIKIFVVKKKEKEHKIYIKTVENILILS